MDLQVREALKSSGFRVWSLGLLLLAFYEAEITAHV